MRPRKTVRRLAVCVVACAVVGMAGACPILNESETIEHDRKDMQRFEQLVLEAANLADTIFIGRVRSVDETEQPEAVHYRARFEVLETLKGQHSTELELEWTVPRMEFTYTCYSSGYFDNVGFTETFRYLVYAKGSIVLHQSEIRDWKSAFTHQDEIHLLESKGRITTRSSGP